MALHLTQAGSSQWPHHTMEHSLWPGPIGPIRELGEQPCPECLTTDRAEPVAPLNSRTPSAAPPDDTAQHAATSICKALVLPEHMAQRAV